MLLTESAVAAVSTEPAIHTNPGHLRLLEAESNQIMREVASEF